MYSPTAKMAGVLTSMALDLGNVSQEERRSVPKGARYPRAGVPPREAEHCAAMNGRRRM